MHADIFPSAAGWRVTAAAAAARGISRKFGKRVLAESPPLSRELLRRFFSFRLVIQRILSRRVPSVNASRVIHIQVSDILFLENFEGNSRTRVPSLCSSLTFRVSRLNSQYFLFDISFFRINNHNYFTLANVFYLETSRVTI